MKTKAIVFDYERSTKNTHKFNEVPPVGEPGVIGALYIQKWFIPTAAVGTKVKVMLQVGESANDLLA